MKRIAVSLLLSLTLCGLICAQSSVQRNSAAVANLEAQRHADDARRARVISLIAQTADEAILWDDREAAVVVLGDAADLSWGESANARGWLLKAWDLIEQVDERENTGDLRQIWRGSQRSVLRTKILTVARKRDPELAECFLTALDADKSEANDGRGAFDDRSARSEQLLRLALTSVDTNPSLALNLAARSLQDGISFNFQTVLLRLRQKYPTFANRLFDLALPRLTTNASTFSEIQILASYLFKPGEVLAQLPGGATTVAVVQTKLPTSTPAQDDPIRARRFLTVIQRILLSVPVPVEEQSPQASGFVLLTASLAQPFQTYAPELLQSVQARSAQFAAKLPAPTRNSNSSAANESIPKAAENERSREEASHLRAAALEKEAERQGNSIARKLKLAEAALATDVKDLAYGKTLAGKIEDDNELRDQIYAFLYYRSALILLNENNLAGAEESALNIPDSSERALALIAIAQKLAVFKPQSADEAFLVDTNRQRAIELLFEADKSLRREDGSSQTARIRLGKISVSHLVDIAQAFSDFEQAIAVINRLDKFDASDGSAPRFGIAGFNTINLTVPRLEFGFGFRNALEPLIKADLELTTAAVERLASPSIRGACRLEIARQVLQSTLKAAPTKIARSNSQPSAP